jgi:predicted Fe-Mo cluster-binding NifX family protein
VGVKHPIDVANAIVCGSCGEEFIQNMCKRGIVVSVATKNDPIEAIKEYLAKGESHYTCDGPHQEVIRRHRNCPHNKENEHKCN